MRIHSCLQVKIRKYHERFVWTYFWSVLSIKVRGKFSQFSMMKNHKTIQYQHVLFHITSVR